MPLTNDLQNKLARLAIAHGRHPVGSADKLVKHSTATVGTETQVTLQQVGGKGPWDALETLYYDGHEIGSANYVFHPGNETDSPDASYFPTDTGHPGASYVNVKLPAGMSADDTPDKLVGIYRTLKVANYNGSGQQLKSNGSLVGASENPLDNLFHYPNPATVAADHVVRWFRKPIARIDWPAWVDWRDYNDELIPWDDKSKTPRNVSAAQATGGSLALATYYVKVAAVFAAGLSSASTEASVTLTGSNNAVQVSWDTEADATGYRVYIGTSSGGQTTYFVASGQATATLKITSLSGTAGTPPAIATGTALRQVKRFECHLFFLPPFKLSDVLNQIALVSCADWQDANGRLRFLSPANRTPVFTFDTTKVAPDSFKTWQISRTDLPKEVIVHYRDLDDPHLYPGEPAVIRREANRGQPLEVNIGSAYRGQAERVASFLMRSRGDMRQMMEAEGAPDSYTIIPADRAFITHPEVSWTNVPFKLITKEEHGDEGISDTLRLQIFSDDLYSDTDHTEKQMPLPAERESPYAAPPAVQAGAYTLVNDGDYSGDGIWHARGLGAFAFGSFVGGQYAVVTVTRGAAVVERIRVDPDEDNQGAFSFDANITGATYSAKVQTYSLLTNATAASGHPTKSVTPAGAPDIPAAPASAGSSVAVAGTKVRFKWPAAVDPKKALKYYAVIDPLNGGAVVQQGLTLEYFYTPAKGELTVTRRVYSVNRTGHSSDELDEDKYLELSYLLPDPTLPAPASASIGFDGTQLIHAWAAVSLTANPHFAGKYRIVTDPDNPDTTKITDVLTNKWNDSQLAANPRGGARYVCAVDKWDNEGIFAEMSYNVTAPQAPTVATYLPGVIPTLKITSLESAEKRKTFRKTTVQQASDAAFTNIVKETTHAAPVSADHILVSLARPTGYKTVYVRARFSDIFTTSDGEWGYHDASL